jgi:hypothetical protein
LAATASGADNRPCMTRWRDASCSLCCMSAGNEGRAFGRRRAADAFEQDATATQSVADDNGVLGCGPVACRGSAAEAQQSSVLIETFLGAAAVDNSKGGA